MRWPVGCAALFVLLQTGLATAAPLTAELEVQRGAGADDCPDAAALKGMVARILNAPAGGGPIGAGGEITASVVFSRTAAGYQATLRLGGAKAGQRTLTDTGPTCTALGRAASITLALVLDAGEELAPPPPPPAPVVVAVVAPAEPPPAPARTSGVLSVTGGPAFGVVGPPSVTSGVALEVGVGRRLRLQLSGQYVAPRSTSFDTGAVDVTLLAARAGICGVLNDPGARVRVGLCARVIGGRLRGSGSGFPAENEAHSLTFWAAGGGVQVQGSLTQRLILGVEADLLAPLASYTFSVGNRGAAYASDAVAATLQLTVGVKIW